MDPLISFEIDILAPETKPIDQRSGHTIFFRQFIEFINHRSIQQTKISRTCHNFHV